MVIFKFITILFCSTNVVMNYTEIEGKVREATNDDPWGPTGPLMQELAHATFSYETFPEVMSMLWKRMLQDNKTNWRRTYKVTIKLIHKLFHTIVSHVDIFLESVAVELSGAQWV